MDNIRYQFGTAGDVRKAIIQMYDDNFSSSELKEILVFLIQQLVKKYQVRHLSLVKK